MRKIMPLLVAGIFLASAFVTLGNAKPINNIESEEIKIEKLFSNIEIEKKEEYLNIELSETNSHLLETGKPVLPCFEKTFTFPLSTKIKNVEVKKENIQKITIKDEIETAPAPQTLNNIQITKDEKVDLKGNYPDRSFEYKTGRGIYSNERCIFLIITVYPVRYLPDEKMIEWAKNVQIDIEYEKPSQDISFDEQYSFIILTPEDFTDELNNLASHKNNKGISTKVVSLDEIYESTYFPSQGRDDQEKIKYFIKNTYDNWGTTNVLLVGGEGYFPNRETHIKVSEEDSEIFVSDLYYADIYDAENNFQTWDTNNNDIFCEYDWGSSSETDEMDLYPDVSIGRLPTISANQVTTVVDKIITYENTEAYTKSWFSDITYIGGDSFPGDADPEPGVLEGEYVNEAVMDIMDGYSSKKLWVSNDQLTGFSGVTNIKNTINEGCGFIDFSGHGNLNVWATHPHDNPNKWLPGPTGGYTSSNINTLINGDKLPIVVTGACSVSKYNKHDNCFSWSWIANSNGGGIASFGATGLGYAYIGEYVTQGLVEAMAIGMFEEYDIGAETTGEMWSRGVSQYISPGVDAGDYKTICEWHLFGDPTLKVQKASQPPLQPDAPSGIEEGGIGTEYTYSTVTTDPEGNDIYYRFDWGDGTYSNWLGPYESGETCEDGKKIWDAQGTYKVRVQAKDINGKISEWSEYKPVTMPVDNDFGRFHWFNILLEKIPILKLLFERIQKIVF